MCLKPAEVYLHNTQRYVKLSSAATGLLDGGARPRPTTSSDTPFPKHPLLPRSPVCLWLCWYPALTVTCACLKSRSSRPAFRALHASLFWHRSYSAASSASRRPSVTFSRASSTSRCFRFCSCDDKNAALTFYIVPVPNRGMPFAHVGRVGGGVCHGIHQLWKRLTACFDEHAVISDQGKFQFLN